jgi:hypothetical protein
MDGNKALKSFPIPTLPGVEGNRAKSYEKILISFPII